MNSWKVTRKAHNLLHTPHPPNDYVLATRGESYCTLFVRVLCYGFMDEKSYVDHWDGTDQSLTRITASPLLVGSETTFHEADDFYFVFVLLGRTPASVLPP